MRKVVLAYSGGLDSTTLLYSLLRATDHIHAVFFNYGSKHNMVERNAASEILYGIPKKIQFDQIMIPPMIFEGSGSALMRESEMPHKTYQELNEAAGPSPTVVPFRNGIILSLCTAIAVSLGYDTIAIAVHGTDAHNWAYPDCSPEFTGAMANAMYVGTYHQVRLYTPFTFWTKSAVVDLACQLKVPVHRTRSCYEADEVACGKCPTCVERIEAFKFQGWIDPIPYAVDVDWSGCQPWPHKGV